MNIISKEVELPGAFILGAAGAASRILGMNAEVNHLYLHHTTRPDDCVCIVELRMCCIIQSVFPGVEALDIIWKAPIGCMTVISTK